MKPSKSVQFTKEIPITIDELANWFLGLITSEKVEFFNSVAKQARDWHGTKIKALKYLSLVSEDAGLSAEANEVLHALAPLNTHPIKPQYDKGN